MSYIYTKKRKADLKWKYDKCIFKVRRFLRKIESKKRRGALEREVAHIINNVESYGFEFFPELYVESEIDKLVNMLGK